MGTQGPGTCLDMPILRDLSASAALCSGFSIEPSDGLDILYAVDRLRVISALNIWCAFGVL